MKKRVLAALLALVMLFGALPMSVFAVDEELDTYADDGGSTATQENTTPAEL